MGSRGKGFSPCFRESSPRPPCVGLPLCPSSRSGICSLCVSLIPPEKAKSLAMKKGLKSLAIDDGFCVGIIARKGKRLHHSPKLLKVSLHRARLLGLLLLLTAFVCATTARNGKGLHHCPKRLKVSLYRARLQGLWFCGLPLCMCHYCPKRAKGYGTLRLPIAPLRGKMLSGVCESADRKYLSYQYFHTCPYL